VKSPQQDGAMIFLYFLAWIIGAMIGWYCGITLFFPAIGIGLVLVTAKFSPIPRLQPFVGALAAQVGLGLFMLVGGITHPDAIRLVIYDLLVLAIDLVWLVAGPGLLPVLLLGAYQIYSLVVNIDRISNYEFGSVSHKAIVATIALRVAAIIALIVGYFRFRKNESANKESEETTKVATDNFLK
jgi:hypothetical protein